MALLTWRRSGSVTLSLLLIDTVGRKKQMIRVAAAVVTLVASVTDHPSLRIISVDLPPRPTEQSIEQVTSMREQDKLHDITFHIVLVTFEYSTVQAIPGNTLLEIRLVRVVQHTTAVWSSHNMWYV